MTTRTTDARRPLMATPMATLMATLMLLALSLLIPAALPPVCLAQSPMIRPNSPLAEQYWKGVLDRSPGNATAHFALGEYYNLTYRNSQSALHYRRAALLRPGWAEAHFRLGMVYRELGRPNEAAAALERAVLLQPAHARAHHYLALAQIGLKRLEDAGASLNRAYLNDPGWAETYYETISAIHAEFNEQETVLALARTVYPMNQRLARLLYNRWTQQNSAMDEYWHVVVNPAPLDELKTGKYR
jgi:tetratricopeptide (TPR) repeat protein